ncbi:MAG: glycosyltransferase family 39 protein [Tatlockia sp.]|nr:glycosyltransferase family 39 protein [Tatlockia sp.]
MDLSEKRGSARYLVLFFLLMSLAFLLRYLIAFQDISYLDRLFILDDSYYILSISRSIAEGLGPSANRIHLTSGFQPLSCLMLVPFFLLGFSADKVLICAIYLSAFWGSLSTLVIAFLLKNLSGIKAALIGSLLWIFCPIILKNDLNGMETSLAGFLNLSVLLVVVLVDKKSSFFSLILLGFLCGLALLARVDSCFLLLAIGIFALVRWGFSKTIFFVLIAFLVVLPWWIYSLKTFSSIVPESGPAVKNLLNYTYKSREYLSLSSFYALIEWFPPLKLTGHSAFLGMVLSIYLILKGSKCTGVYGYLIGIPFIWVLAFYTWYLPAFWYFTRYYYFIYALIIICISLTISLEKRKKFNYLYLSFIAIILAVYFIELVSFFAKPERTPDGVLGSLKGYREVVLEIHKKLKPGDVVGSFQSGALAYYAPPSVRVINLDGVVNSLAAKALKARGMKSYVDSEGMNRFADWEADANFFQSVYGGNFPRGCFNTIYRAKKQGSQNFVLRNYNPNCES